MKNLRSNNKIERQVYKKRMFKVNNIVTGLIEKKEESGIEKEFQKYKDKYGKERTMLWDKVDELESMILRLKHERGRLDERNVFLEEESAELKANVVYLTTKSVRLKNLLNKELARSEKNWNISMM